MGVCEKRDIRRSDGFYTRMQVHEMLGVSHDCICSLEAKGILPAPKRKSLEGWGLYTLDEVQALARALRERGRPIRGSNKKLKELIDKYWPKQTN